jgi:hypothetical protein
VPLDDPSRPSQAGLPLRCAGDVQFQRVDSHAATTAEPSEDEQHGEYDENDDDDGPDHGFSLPLGDGHAEYLCPCAR